MSLSRGGIEKEETNRKSESLIKNPLLEDISAIVTCTP